MVKKKTKKRAAKPRKGKPIIMDIGDIKDELSALVQEVRMAADEELELFVVSAEPGGIIKCLVKALSDRSPHQFGHLLGDVLRTHAKVYAKTFKLDEAETTAQILEGLIHEIADTLRAVQRARFDAAEDRLSQDDPTHPRHRGKRVH